MSVRRRPTVRPTLRRSITALVAAVATAAGLVVAAAPAQAAGPWFVAPGGSNAASCLTANAPCATVAGVLAKGGFVSGDTINVAPGTYVGTTTFAAKGANVVGTGAGVIFDGGNTGSASTMAVTGAVNVSLSNLTLRNGFNNSSFGGGLRVQAGTVTTQDVTLSANRSALGGGAIVYQGATLSMTGGSITNNTSTATANLTGAGGGVYIVGRTATSPAGRLTLDGVSVTGNTATGAAVLFSGNGGGIFNAGTTVVTGSTFSGNRAVASTANVLRSGQGGGLFNGAQDGDDAPTLRVEDSTIVGGLPSGTANAGSGGAIANVETSLGGTSVSGALTLTGTTMRGNVAVLGGGVYNGGTAVVTGGLIENNTAYSGGGVYQSPIVLATAAATATFDGTSFTGNVANGLAAANYGNGGAIFNGETLTVRNATFEGNKAIASTSGGGASGWGGAIFNGAFVANDAPELTITDTDIRGGGVSGTNAVVGGGIASTGNVFGFAGAVPAKLVGTGLSLIGNTAAAGGGLYAGGRTTITDGLLEQNAATNTSFGFGGGIYAAASPSNGPAPTLDLVSVDVADNEAALAGGGLALLARVVTDIDDSQVTTNTAGVSGGGIFNAGDLTVASSEIDHNAAAFQGGGVYNGSSVAADSPRLVLTGTSVLDNTAASAGGGLVTIKGATLTATGGEVSGNSAVGGGGVVVGDGAPATFDGTDFIGNTASALGGGAILNSGTTTVSRATLAGNKALHTTGNTGLGGAIYSGSNAANAVTSLTLEASTVTGNEAWAAPVLVTYSPASGATNTTSIDRSTITGNTSETNVGAIEQFHPLTITASTITDNTADGGSGSLSLFAPAGVGIAGTILSGNSGPECSGAVVDGGYNLADTGDASCGFSAASNDVAADPQLGALVDNGGPTQTRKPGPSSPALDRVPAATTTALTDAVSGAPVALCAAGALDQRGIARPQGARCDIGAVEVVQTAPTVDGPATADFTVGSAAVPVAFTSTGTPTATLTAGSLPAGVTFTDNGDGTGSLAGTPAAGAGGDYTITITATNEAGSGSATVDLIVRESPRLSGPSASTYRVGEPGGPDEFEQTGGHPTATLSTDSTLPGGVDFTPQAGGKATIGGTPVAGAGGQYPITIVGSNGTAPDATWPFLLTVEEGPGLTGPDTATFTVGANGASDEFSATGFPTPALSASGLPAGLNLHGAGPGTARISGQPADGTGGVYDVTVTAGNGIGDDASKQVAVTVNEAPELTGPTDVRFVAESAGLTVFSSDGFPAATLSIEGDLPAGVTFTDNGNGTASLSGTPGAASVGSYEITVRASNGIDPDAVLEATLVVVPPLSIATTNLPDASIGTAYGSPILATGGLPPYEFTLVSGTLPAGLSLGADGVVSGTPTGPAGTSTFEVKVVDVADPEQSATKQISITVTKGTTTLAVDPVLIQNIFTFGVTVRIGVVGATLTGGTPAQPVAGRTVVFKAGAVPVCTGVTNAQGRVTCTMNLVNTLLVVLNLGVSATFAGDSDWQSASGAAGLL